MSGSRLVKVLFADDEPVVPSELRAMLVTGKFMTGIGKAFYGPAALAAIDSLLPQRVFLDIEKPALLGTDVLCRAKYHPHQSCTTAWMQQSVAAFGLGALDYLLQPSGSQLLALTPDLVRATLSESDITPALNRY